MTTGTDKHNACLICSSDKIASLKNYESAHLVKCGNCGLVFCSLIPEQNELDAVYNAYVREAEISPITIRRYNQLLDSFEPYRKTGNILDAGCGDGYFLDEAKKRGWNVFGTEMTEKAVGFCSSKGINMHRGTVESSDFSGDFFDVITSFEVIEHLHNPVEVRNAFARFLRKDGLLYVTTPNFNGLGRRRSGSKWREIDYPEHLVYYTPSTLNKLFSNTFRHTETLTTGFTPAPGNSIVTGTGNVERLREKTETKLSYRFAKSFVNFVLNLTGTGDHLKARYTRK